MGLERHLKTPLRVFFWISLASHAAAAAIFLAPATATVPAASGKPDVTERENLDAPIRELSLETESESVPSTLSSEVPRPHSRQTEEGSGRDLHADARSQALRESPRGGGEGRARANAATSGTFFGAVGDRAAVDLATAFTRGFPQAASADPAWATAPFGAAGEAVVTLQIDGDGALIDAKVDGSPSAPLRAGIARTVALLRTRAFTAHGPVTRLQATARVTPDEVHDGLHGEVFAIGGSFDARLGSAFFALAIGRRVDLQVRTVR